VELNYKKMCVAQGYVPETCKLDGTMVWGLINKGEDPCEGCNCDRTKCNGRPKKSKCTVKDIMWDSTAEDNRRKCALEIKRKESHIDRCIMTLDMERGRRERPIEIKINDPYKEKTFITNCETIEEMEYIVAVAINKYKVIQILIEVGYGDGQLIYNIVSNNKYIIYSEIDVVPLKYEKLNIK